MTHPMSEPWVNWQPISTFPRDGEAYLVCDNRIMGGDHEVVWFDDEVKTGWCLATSDGPHYHIDKFTHWAKLPEPPQ